MKKGILPMILLVILSVAFVFGAWAIINQATVGHDGKVKGIGIDLYEDESLLIPWEHQSWGLVEPNETYSKDFWAHNTGNSPVTLELLIDNWYPTNASDYLEVTWSYNNEVIEPDEALALTMYLSVDPSIEGIEDFSFDTTIIALG